MTTMTAPQEVNTMPTTDEALETLRSAADEYREADARAMRCKRERDRALVNAQAAGATYPQMAAAMSLSRDRVAQVLAAERKRGER